eukprot:COSAG06_NODE_13582_length_1242_cov_1.632546_2_plen_171_part_00
MVCICMYARIQRDLVDLYSSRSSRPNRSNLSVRVGVWLCGDEAHGCVRRCAVWGACYLSVYRSFLTVVVVGHPSVDEIILHLDSAVEAALPLHIEAQRPDHRLCERTCRQNTGAFLSQLFLSFLVLVPSLSWRIDRFLMHKSGPQKKAFALFRCSHSIALPKSMSRSGPS